MSQYCRNAILFPHYELYLFIGYIHFLVYCSCRTLMLFLPLYFVSKKCSSLTYMLWQSIRLFTASLCLWICQVKWCDQHMQPYIINILESPMIHWPLGKLSVVLVKKRLSNEYIHFWYQEYSYKICIYEPVILFSLYGWAKSQQIRETTSSLFG